MLIPELNRRAQSLPKIVKQEDTKARKGKNGQSVNNETQYPFKSIISGNMEFVSNGTINETFVCQYPYYLMDIGILISTKCETECCSRMVILHLLGMHH